MSISLVCATCGTKLKAPDSAAGRKTKCPKCGDLIRVPTVVPSPESLAALAYGRSDPSPPAPRLGPPAIPPLAPKPGNTAKAKVLLKTAVTRLTELEQSLPELSDALTQALQQQSDTGWWAQQKASFGAIFRGEGMFSVWRAERELKKANVEARQHITGLTETIHKEVRLGLKSLADAAAEDDTVTAELQGAMWKITSAKALAYGIKARAHGALRELKDAEDAIRLSLSFMELPQTWTILGDILQARGRRPEAREAYDKAVNLDPDDDGAVEAMKKIQDLDAAGTSGGGCLTLLLGLAIPVPCVWLFG